MRATALIDTGAILAALNANDRWHAACVDALEDQILPLGTTTAVLTELFHLVRRFPNGTEAAVRFVESGAIVLLPISHEDLPEIHKLMARYKDRPMDFADATLVHAANVHDLPVILTTDHGDFETYRMSRRRRFRILPVR